MLLLLNSLAHLLVDGLCAAVLFGPVQAAESPGVLILLYNTLAFSTQCVVGLAADRLKKQGLAAAVSMLLMVLGFALPLGPVLRVCLVGLGNSGFHVAGGVMTLERGGGKAGKLGVFVAPGAVGLTLGTLWPRLGTVFAVLLALCALAVIPLEKRSPADPLPELKPGRQVSLAVPLLLALAVAVRAVGGCAVSFPWKEGAALTLALTFCVFAGKTAGGFLCDRFGPNRTSLVSMVAAAVLVAFCARWAVPSLAGQFLLNLTMPVTLWLMYRALPDQPGFAFGLAASALWPGTFLGLLLNRSDLPPWPFVILGFLFGLAAILWAAGAIRRARSRGAGAPPPGLRQKRELPRAGSESVSPSTGEPSIR